MEKLEEVINWFKNIQDKSNCKFVQFDIESFYPSITLRLFSLAINYAKSIIPIANSDFNIIMQARKTLLFSNGELWVKKNGDENFDVPMGCYDGAEICELVGTFLLSKLDNIIRKDKIGIYRDDGLGVLRSVSGTITERKKKSIIKVFQDHDLKITIDMGINNVDFLDVSFDLHNDTYKPYMKPNNEPVYIHRKSNHPPSIVKQIPTMIGKRLSELSKNEQVFEEARPKYEEALRKSGYNDTLQYIPPQANESTHNNAENRSRKRQIIWFNPPYAQNVETNIGRVFLGLIDKHFPAGKKTKDNKELHKIFSRNSVKVSYCCTTNVGSVISSHNQKLLHPTVNTYGCNCRDRENCPLDGKCTTPGVVYKAIVTNDVDDESKTYIGMTMPPFKTRYNNHNTDFGTESKRNTTDLSKYMWDLRENGKEGKVNFEIMHQVLGKVKYGFCRLCLTEKMVIIENLEDENVLNTRDEFISKCRHQNAWLLKERDKREGVD